MNRQTVVAGAVAGALAVAAVALWATQRAHVIARETPAWADGQQPPDNVAADLPCLSPDQSWAANRARSMSACCAGNTAGARIRRTYPGSLCDEPSSLIGLRFAFDGGVSV